MANANHDGAAQDALRQGDVEACHAALVAAVKAEPGDARHRAFLAQLMMVEGQWDRAVKQLDVLGNLDATALDLVTDLKAGIEAEQVRAEVMAGKRTPAIFGQPAEWIAQMVEALRLDAQGQPEQAHALREEAFAAAPASPGDADGARFDWLSDADQRFGPVLEAVMNGEYHWIPFDAIATLSLEPPRDLRDLVFTVGIVTLANGGEWPIMVPTRYPGSDTSSGADPAHALARRTDWDVLHGEHYAGTGQRMLATSETDLPLLDLRAITFDRAAEAEAAKAAAAPADGEAASAPDDHGG